MNNITETLINIALKEDGVLNDITTKHFVPKDKKASAVLIINKPGILCGIDIFIKVFKMIDKKCKVSLKKKDGSLVKSGDEVLHIEGPAWTILSGERTALNFLQYMSGIATMTNQIVSSVNNNKAKIYDTRKTTPCYRELAKYAVKCGGGANHRMGLQDMVLIKDNHLKLIKNLAYEIAKFRKKHKNILIEIECENKNEVKQALNVKSDVIMLDNMSLENMKKMIKFIRKSSTKEYKPEIEISGGLTPKTAKVFSKLDVDRISIGMITHSSVALDISLEITIK
ncbi:MAG: carboxylating nicotinate-nucleotide diphosphorylase [Endomicrobium sp.]|jgi:nicotinate-nucleotide pyrophosphorylase (carboxylating)|nr:carboxylating nicotinate-nucleotide diphosphorylase [Endomicrobium sp.]